MNISRTTRAAMSVVGLRVDASWERLAAEMPAAWGRIFSRGDELRAIGCAGAFLEYSFGPVNGVYREMIGLPCPPDVVPPSGLVRIDIPENDFLHMVHEGEVNGIAASFGAMLAHAESEAISTSDHKLDIGYVPDEDAGRHDLFIGLSPFRTPDLP